MDLLGSLPDLAPWLAVAAMAVIVGTYVLQVLIDIDYAEAMVYVRTGVPLDKVVGLQIQ